MAKKTGELESVLKAYFGYDSFRAEQKQIIESVLNKEDSIVLMPTGGGKSLCFQLPALCVKGVTLVISPLIALMKDQVDSLTANGIPAASLTSSQSMKERRAIEEDLLADKYKLLYIAPERLKNPYFKALLQRLPISLIAIDEAHCISEWGHDFRPDYRNLKELRKAYSTVPFIALTATATKPVLTDIANQLSMQEAKTFITSFNRPNLSYHIHSKQQSFSTLLDYIKKQEGGATIIYRFSRKGTESLAADLKAEGYKVAAYHAGLPNEKRRKVQEKFIRDEIQIIVATIAFGMGIDKPDIRLVVHYEIPKSVEGYFQETGRAGRDGLPSECVLFYAPGDRQKHQFFINQIDGQREKLQSQEKLDDVCTFCELSICRRKYLLEYFGEDWNEDNCKSCDACLHPKQQFDATAVSKLIIQAIAESGQRFGAVHIVNILKGSRRKQVVDAGHTTLKTYGSVKDFSLDQLKNLIAQLLQNGYLRKTKGEYPVIMLTMKSKEVFTEDLTVLLNQPEKEVRTIGESKKQIDIDYDKRLFELLRSLRKEIADENDVPPFVIFGDRSLIEMSAYYPKSEENFFLIKGVGKEKVKQFGKRFLKVIKDYTDQEEISEKQIPRSTKVYTGRKKSNLVTYNSTYQETKRLIEKGMSIQEVAIKKRCSDATIIGHLGVLIESGESINMDHLKKDIPNLREIVTAFKKTKGNKLKPVYLSLDEKVSYDEIRLGRLFVG